jgi:hypothetical protein
MNAILRWRHFAIATYPESATTAPDQTNQKNLKVPRRVIPVGRGREIQPANDFVALALRTSEDRIPTRRERRRRMSDRLSLG